MRPALPPTSQTTTATHPCHGGHRLLYVGYLFAGTTALALATLAIGEGDGRLALRGLSALFAAGCFRAYLQQAGQFDACADNLDSVEKEPSHTP